VPPAWAGDPGALLDAWADFAPRSTDPRTTIDRARQAVGLTAKARIDLERVLPDLSQQRATEAARQRKAEYDEVRVNDSLDLAAVLIRSDAKPRVVYVNGIGDYDTHQGQAGRHPDLLAQLDGALDRFFTSLGPEAQHVAVATVAEFGRRPHENGTGTDHGTASTHLVIGPRVKGGRYGESPSLTKLDGTNNLVHTVDFRSQYATLLTGWLGVEHEPILGDAFEVLPVFR
jgi:uncharacterized protein (DUF1501 family)